MSKLFNTSLNRIVGNTVKRFQRKTNKIRPPSDGLLASGFALFTSVSITTIGPPNIDVQLSGWWSIPSIVWNVQLFDFIPFV